MTQAIMPDSLTACRIHSSIFTLNYVDSLSLYSVSLMIDVNTGLDSWNLYRMLEIEIKLRFKFFNLYEKQCPYRPNSQLVLKIFL